MNNTLKQHARTLRLSGLLESLELRLQEAEANRLPHAQFLELLFQDEINVRHQRLINRRHKLADFREVRSLDNFDFSFNPNTNRAQIYELATGHFVAQRRDVLHNNLARRCAITLCWDHAGLSHNEIAALFRMPSSNSVAQTIRRTKAHDAQTLKVLKNQISHK